MVCHWVLGIQKLSQAVEPTLYQVGHQTAPLDHTFLVVATAPLGHMTSLLLAPLSRIILALLWVELGKSLSSFQMVRQCREMFMDYI